MNLLKVAGGVLFFSLCSQSQAEYSVQEQQALAVAKSVDTMVRTTRGLYTKMVVKKLKKDGKGAKQKSHKLKGYVPLPAQFIREVSKKSATSQNQFSFELRSLWNLNPDQGLQDEFEKQGWDFLAKQQESANGNFKSIQWQPYVKIEETGGKSYLRYFRD
jgi:hypothetical protein